LKTIRITKKVEIKEVRYKETLIPQNVFSIKGRAKIQSWTGSVGFIDMYPYTIEIDEKEDLTHSKIMKEANDGGFGAADIISCTVDIKQFFERKRVYFLEDGSTNEEVKLIVKEITKNKNIKKGEWY